VATTSRFNFEKFGGGLGGSIEDDGGKFSSTDRDVLDRILASLEVHAHTGGSRLGDPSAAPTAALGTAGGLLPGVTYYYRISYIDRFGLESAASDEVAITTPPPVDPPFAPIVTTEPGGTLEPGITYWAGTSMAGGVETPLGDPTLLTIEDNFTVNLDFDVLPTGADSIGVWRQGPADAGFTRIGETNPGETTFVDDGSVPGDPCACDPSLMPPEQNLTGVTSSVVITVPDADTELVGAAPIDTVLRWRIYRTDTSGVYDASALVHEVVETTDGTPATGLFTEWEDVGDPLQPGAPLEASTTLTPSVPISGGGGGGPGGISAFLLADSTSTLVGFIEDFDRSNRAIVGDSGWFASTTDGSTAELAIRSNRLTVPSDAPGGAFAGYAPVLHSRNDDNTAVDVSVAMTFDTSDCDATLVAASDATFDNAVAVEITGATTPQLIVMKSGGTYDLAWDLDHGTFNYFVGSTSLIRVTYVDSTKVLNLYQDDVLCFEAAVGPQMTGFGQTTPALVDMPNAGLSSNGGIPTGETESCEKFDDFVCVSAAAPKTWRVIADDTGVLVTRLSGGAAPDSDIYLQSRNLTFYKLTIDTSGALITTAGTPSSTDTMFLFGSGPLLPCSDPTVAWQLGVTNDGALTTVEV